MVICSVGLSLGRGGKSEEMYHCSTADDIFLIHRVNYGTFIITFIRSFPLATNWCNKGSWEEEEEEGQLGLEYLFH